MLTYFKLKSLSCVLISIAYFHEAACATRVPNIAIVGGGIGGTSAAYFLRELMGPVVPIDLYEANKIGGRLATVTINNEDYETGGAVIHPKNKYMLDFLKLAGKQKRKNVFSKFGMYDGSEFVFTESDWEYFTLLKLFWRYDYGPVKLNRYVEDMLKSFSRIYDLQDRNQCYTSVTDLLRAMDSRFVDDLKVSTKKGFAKEGFSDRMIDELIMATLTVNYGQTTDAHKFVGLVSVAGADGGLWAVEGGNKHIPEKLLEMSGAQHFQRRVTKVIYDTDLDLYTLEHKASPAAPTNITNYDIVIMATPLTGDVSGIEFDLPNRASFPGRYHRTVCTIVEGTFNHLYFGLDSADEMVDEILTVNLESFFNSVGRINAVNARVKRGTKSDVWKIFSQDLIQEGDLKSMFSEIKNVHVTDWLAYPHYQSMLRNDSFILHKNLFHVNAIEWAASAMEMSVIGAKNVALLAYKTWNGLEYLDPSKSFKDEF